jgi:hypothetical protein
MQINREFSMKNIFDGKSIIYSLQNLLVAKRIMSRTNSRVLDLNINICICLLQPANYENYMII